MYRLFSKSQWSFFLLTYSFFILAALALSDLAGANSVTTVRYLVMIVFVITTHWFGASYYYSGWRMLWRRFPVLNKLLFPDLNGVWIGESHSNWPIIKTMKDAALNGNMVATEKLDEVELQKNAMAVEIKASLFSVKVKARLSSTNGDSYSLTSTVSKKEQAETVNLLYVYEQQTPNPGASDHDVHMGAADLSWSKSKPNQLHGPYWTRRCWWKGLNTAGNIILNRQTDKVDACRSLDTYL
jgi:predicted pore-forming effector associated with SMODS systems